MFELNGVLLMNTPNGAAEAEVTPTAAGTTANDEMTADINRRTRFMWPL
jgi:hypothetical protein